MSFKSGVIRSRHW